MKTNSEKQGWNTAARSFEPRLVEDSNQEESYNQSQSDNRGSNSATAQLPKTNDNNFMPYFINGNQNNDLVTQMNNITLSQYDPSQYFYLQSLGLLPPSFPNHVLANRMSGTNKGSTVVSNNSNPFLNPYLSYNRMNQSPLMPMPYVIPSAVPNMTNAAGRSKRNSCTVSKVFNTGDKEIDIYLTESYKTINPRSDFNRDMSNSRFFVIKSYTEEHVHRSIKYGEWCSTQRGNEILDQAYRSVKSLGGHVYLFFSVNSSGYFCGVAEMMSECDTGRRSSHWNDDKWQGGFLVRWLYVKDVPNKYLKHIILEYNDNRPITNSRDATEMKPAQKGYETLRLMHEYHHNSSLFDDFEFYENREKEGVNNNKTIQ